MKIAGRLLIWGMLMSIADTVYAYPTVCSVVNTPSFQAGLAMTISPTVCGYPPRPCAHFSYYVPQTYIEVVGAKESFFMGFGSSASQLAKAFSTGPYAAESDHGAFSYQAHTINVPYAAWAFNELPCGGAMWDRYCFSAMSEHLGANWRTGAADSSQPAFLAWSTAPKACLIKGAATGISGESRPTAYPNIGMCSIDRSWMKTYPPSGSSICTAWGIHFPRTGTVTSSDQTTASLVIASRIKSLGAEVFMSVPSVIGEKWQMIYPQNSSIFYEGQNIGLLRLKQVSEIGRFQARPKNYLYVTWKRVSCTKDVYWVPFTQAWVSGLQSVCAGYR